MKKIKLILLCFLVMTILASCSSGKQQTMEGSSIVPSAQGNVTVKADKNDNTNVTVKVKHLAPPQKLALGATNYIVWVIPEGGRDYQNVGALKVDKDLEGFHSTTVPYKNFKVLVTPEVTSMAQNPTGPAVFEQRIMRQ